jgi:hypothetical protein
VTAGTGVTHLRRSGFFRMRTQTFRSGLTCAAPKALVRDESACLAHGGSVGARANHSRPAEAGQHDDNL